MRKRVYVYLRQLTVMHSYWAAAQVGDKVLLYYVYPQNLPSGRPLDPSDPPLDPSGWPSDPITGLESLLADHQTSLGGLQITLASLQIGSLWTEFLPILQNFVPYWGLSPVTQHKHK